MSDLGDDAPKKASPMTEDEEIDILRLRQNQIQATLAAIGTQEADSSRRIPNASGDQQRLQRVADLTAEDDRISHRILQLIAQRSRRAPLK